MKATKKIGLIFCVIGILLTGIAIAQTSSTTARTNNTAASTNNTAASTNNTAASTNNTAASTDADASQLVMVIESEGDLDEVAQAIYLTGTDTLVATIPEGVTIFAPVDGSFDQDVVVEEVITSYIIPGIIDTADIAADSSTTTTAMSGTPVTIAVVDEVLTVNGVPLMDAQAIYTDNAVIYKLADSFTGNDLASNK